METGRKTHEWISLGHAPHCCLTFLWNQVMKTPAATFKGGETLHSDRFKLSLSWCWRVREHSHWVRVQLVSVRF